MTHRWCITYGEGTGIKNEKPAIAYWLEKSLYLNITNKCSNYCVFCIRNVRSGVDGFKLKLDKEPTIDDVISEIRKVLGMKNWREVVFCGFGEPTERLNLLLEVTRWLKRNCDKPLFVRVDTNGHGYLLNKGRNVAKELKDAGVDKVSVSLNAYDDESYRENCRPKLDGAYGAVIDFMVKAKNVGLEVEATAVAAPEVDIGKIREVAERIGVKLVVRQYIQCFF